MSHQIMATCFWGATSLKQKLGYDDSLDAFGVHGIGGIVGAVLTGVFAAESVGGQGLAKASIAAQVGSQLIGVVFTIVYCAVLSFIILLELPRFCVLGDWCRLSWSCEYRVLNGGRL